MKINMINNIKHRITSDSILSRFCLVSLIWIIVGGFSTSVWGANVDTTTVKLALCDPSRDSKSITANSVTFSLGGSCTKGIGLADYYYTSSGKEATLSWSAVPDGYTINVSQIKITARRYGSTGTGYGKYYTSKNSAPLTFCDNGKSFTEYTLNNSSYFGLGNDGSISIKAVDKELNYKNVIFTYTLGNNYSIVFNSNGGSGSMSNLSMAYYIPKNLTANAFTRAYTISYDKDGGTLDAELTTANTASSYTFAGWATSAGGDVVYADQALVSNLTETVNGTYNLYAKWTNGGVTLPTGTKDGYFLEGWYDGETRVGHPGDTYYPTANVELKANWEEFLNPEFVGDDLEEDGLKVGANYTSFVFRNVSPKIPTNNSSDNFYYIIDNVKVNANTTGCAAGTSDKVISYDPSTNTLTALNAGTADITFYQKAISGEHIVANSQKFSVEVTKNNPEFTWTPQTYYYNSTYADIFSSSNHDTQLTCSTTNSGAAEMVNGTNSYQKTLKTYNDASATITISQAENYKWNPKSVDTYAVANNKVSNHVQFTYTEAMFNDATITTQKESKNYGMKWDASAHLKLGGDGTGITDEAYDWTDKYVVIRIKGIPNILTFQHRTNNTNVSSDGKTRTGKWYVKESVNGSDWTDVNNGSGWSSTTNSTSMQNSGDIQLQPTTQYIKLCYGANYAGYYYNVTVTELQYFRRQGAATTLDFASSALNNAPATQSFVVEHANAGYQTKVIAPTHYQVSLNNIDFADSVIYSNNATALTGGDKMGTFTVYVKYLADAVGTHSSNVVVKNNLRDNFNVAVTGTTIEKLPTHLVYIGSNSYSINAGPIDATSLFQVWDTNNDTVLINPVITLSSDDTEVITTANEDTKIAFVCGGSSATITASYAGATIYAPATNNNLGHSITVNKLSDVITWKSGAINEEDGKIHVWAYNTLPYDIAGAHTRVNYTSDDEDEDYLEISNGDTFEETTLVTKKYGEITLTATSTGDCTYATTNASKKIVIDPCPHQIIWEQNFRGLTTDEEGKIKAEYELNAYAVDSDSVATNIDIIYSMPTVSFATLKDNILTISNVGETTITATTATDDKFATVSYPKTLKIRLYGEECESNALPDDAAKEIAFEDIKADPANPTAATYYLSAPVDSLVYYVRKYSSLTTGTFELWGYDFATSSWKAMEDSYGPGDVTTDSGGSRRVVHFAASDSTVRILKWESTANVAGKTVNNWEEGSKYIKNAVAAPLKIFEANRSFITRDAESPIMVGDLFEVTITLRYCDKPHISYSYTGDYLTLTPDRTVTNDCGDYGSYTFTLSGRIPVAGTYNEHILFTTSALDEIDIPVNLVVSTDGTYTIDAANWSDDSDAASITSQSAVSVASSTHVTISSPVSVYSLAIPSGSTVTIAPTGGLTVGAGGIAGDGKNNITLKAGTKGQTGYLRVSPDWVGTMPNATVELYSVAYADNSNRTATWQYVGIPLADDTYGWDVCTTYGQQFIYGWNEATGGWFDAYEEKIDPFKGYCLTQNYDKDGKVFTFTGKLSAPSKQEITLSYSETGDSKGYHVLANSFAAPIDITLLTAKDFGGATGTIYLFNTGSYSASGYTVVEGANSDTKGQYIAVTPGTAHGIFASDDTYPIVIPPMQGFCVKTDKEVTMTLDYRKLVWEANYGTHPNQPMRVVAKNTDEPNVTDFIKVTLSDGEAGDNLYLLASGSYDKSYENGYDAPKMMSDDPALPNIFAVEDDGQLAIDATSDMEGTFLGVRTGAATQYTMYFSHVDCETEWMLLDIERNEKTLITDGASYKFSAPAGQTINDRFLIVEYDGSVGVTTGTDEIKTENKIQKFIYNDQMYILKDGVLYDARGMLIRR